MSKQSAGLLVYRVNNNNLEVLIAHMGSPWWAKKDKGAWSVPKGEYQEDEEPLDAARREFREELGTEPPNGELIELGTIQQKNNKTVTAWAVKGDLNASRITSNTFKLEWPPRSGKTREFPEIDRAEWMPPEKAVQKLIPEQAPLVERLVNQLGFKMDGGTAATDNQASLF